MAGPKNATTGKDGQRIYTWRGENFWSVTTIIGGGVPKPTLLPWGIKAVAEAAVEAISYLPQMVADDREGAIKWLKGSPYSQRDKSADLGSLIHEMAEAHALGKPQPKWSKEAQPYMEGFLQFIEDFDPGFLALEASVFNREQRYAGTLDAIATIQLPLHPEPQTFLIDTKTGKGVYPEVALQLAAYRRAEFIGLPDGSETPLPDIDGALCLHLTPDGYRLIEIDTGDDVYAAFLYAREVFRWSQETSKTVLGAEYGPNVQTKVAV